MAQLRVPGALNRKKVPCHLEGQIKRSKKDPSETSSSGGTGRPHGHLGGAAHLFRLDHHGERHGESSTTTSDKLESVPLVACPQLHPFTPRPVLQARTSVSHLSLLLYLRIFC